jgi:hypothetical protein
LPLLLQNISFQKKKRKEKNLFPPNPPTPPVKNISFIYFLFHLQRNIIIKLFYNHDLLTEVLQFNKLPTFICDTTAAGKKGVNLEKKAAI